MDKDQLIADLQATKAELANRGRCRQGLHNGKGEVCLLGAIGAAIYGQEFLDGICRSLSEEATGLLYLETNDRSVAVIGALRQHIAPVGWREELPSDRIWAFNDDCTTSDTDVFNVLDKALADLGGL